MCAHFRWTEAAVKAQILLKFRYLVRLEEACALVEFKYMCCFVLSVFSLPVFEVGISQAIPEDKLTLINMVQEREANWFHFKFCPKCHQVPQAEEWILSTAGTNMEIFATAKRRGNRLWRVNKTD